MSNLGTFSLYGFDEEEKKRLAEIKDKLANAAIHNSSIENQEELTGRLKEELNREELRDLLTLRDKFKSKYLEVYPEALDKGPGQADNAFFETLGIADVEKAYQSKQTELKTYRLANGEEMGYGRARFYSFFRENNVSEARQLQLMSILRATGRLESAADSVHSAVLDNLQSMLEMNFLQTDDAVKAFIENYPTNKNFKEGHQMDLYLALAYAEFYGDDPKKISAFFLAVNDEDAVFALTRLYNLRPTLEGDLNHLLYWVEAVKNNSRKGNTLALAFLQPETIEIISRLLPDYKERSRFINAVFYSLPDTPVSTAMLQEWMLDVLEAPGPYPDYQAIELAKPAINSAEHFYRQVAHSCLDLNHLFIKRGKNQGTHLVAKRSSTFNKHEFLQVYALVEELLYRDRYAKFTDDHMPGSVSELAKRVEEQGSNIETLEAN